MQTHFWTGSAFFDSVRGGGGGAGAEVLLRISRGGGTGERVCCAERGGRGECLEECDSNVDMGRRLPLSTGLRAMTVVLVGSI